MRVGFSAGVSEHGLDGTTLHDVCRRADEALYVAKALGRGRVVGAGWTPSDDATAQSVDVLVVEDDDVVAGLLCHSLDAGGYRSERVADGEAALALLTGAAGRAVRLVLLDISLPGLDGFAVLEKLRHAGVLETTPVIALTARSTEAEVLRCLELGAIDHVAKPFSLPVLCQRVRRALERVK